jgi:CRP-like cAMP-binding protein
MRTIGQLLPDHPFFSGLDAGALTVLAGCARNVSFAPGEYLFRTGQPADQFFVVRRGRVALEVHSPATGTMVVDTADAGDVVGWSWLVPPYTWLFDARAAEPTGAVSFDGRCLRDKCEEDPRLGYELMKLVSQVMLTRLTAARVRLLDVYGTTASISPLLSPLLSEARAIWSRPTTAGASGPEATIGEATMGGATDAGGADATAR